MTLPLSDIRGDDLRPRRVLIVEDEPLIAFDLISAIEADGHHVIGQCRTAHDAVHMTGNLNPDIVIMDIGLDGPDCGLDAAREIRRRFDIGCVFVSATLDRVDPETWGDIEPVALIRKPYRDQVLTKAISIRATVEANDASRHPHGNAA